MQEQTTGRGLQIFTDAVLHSLQEQLAMEELAVRKMRFYESQVQDNELKHVISSMREQHEGHYNTLMRHLLSQETKP
ncbi:MAG: spore coat protein [Firmicutes bacterium]|nr:spore coat protein [Bacillota bacterium]